MLWSNWAVPKNASWASKFMDTLNCNCMHLQTSVAPFSPGELRELRGSGSASEVLIWANCTVEGCTDQTRVQYIAVCFKVDSHRCLGKKTTHTTSGPVENPWFCDGILAPSHSKVCCKSLLFCGMTQQLTCWFWLRHPWCLPLQSLVIGVSFVFVSNILLVIESAGCNVGSC